LDINTHIYLNLKTSTKMPEVPDVSLQTYFTTGQKNKV